MVNESVKTIVEISTLIALGSIIGVAYFSALWWTLRRLTQVRRPALLMTTSLVVRLSVLLVFFYLILQNDRWTLLLAALLGFMLSKLIMAYYLQAVKGLRKSSSVAGDAP